MTGSVDGIVGSVSFIFLDISSDGKNLDLDCFRQKFDSHVLHFISSADQISTSLVVDALLQMAEWLLEEEKLEDQTCAEYWLSMTEPVNQFCASSWDVPETISVLSHAAKTSEQEAEKHVLQATRLRDDPRAYFKHGMGLSGLFQSCIHT